MQAPDWGNYDTNGTDYDYIYNNSDERDNWNSEQAGVFRHLVGQLGTGQTLQNLALPTFVLERRSLLEMYADFFAHPDELIAGAYENTPEKRFLAVLKYYLNSFYPARKTDNAKKPYNPILGEVFRCRWTLPGVPLSASRTAGGPFPRSATNQMTFIGEQVSHHPPISAFYVEHPESGVTCTSYIYTESHIAGLTSVGVRNIGRATVQLQNHNETYMATFPDAFARNVFGKPWFELAGKVELSCLQTGYSAKIEFHARPLFFGSAHQIQGQVYHREVAVMQLKGDWRGEIVMKRTARGAFQTLYKCAGEVRRDKGMCQGAGPEEQRKPKIVASSHRCSVLQRHKNGEPSQALHRATPAGRGQATQRTTETPVEAAPFSTRWDWYADRRLEILRRAGMRNEWDGDSCTPPKNELCCLITSSCRFIFPAFPPVESANATDGETVAKWLFTPSPDGGPKWLKCLVNSSLDQWTTNMEQLRTAFSNASSPVTFHINLTLSSTLIGSVVPFFLINEVTGEQLALEQYDLDNIELLRCPPIGWVWENWKNEWTESCAARPRRLSIWIRDGGFDEGLLDAASPGSSGEQQ
ncbi:hypothetical protein niasHT_001887 [Heterodera trifolii]|uniref:Oxysterol-binding protein n=1 Tax=Heterodera trifolii TaxID=157864 RepID=A0ABD2LQ80_9BILA